METENNFSFEGKKVTVVGGKGKMGRAFSEGLERVGAKICTVDLDTEPLGEKPETDVVLFAVNELTTIELLRQIHKTILESIPIITTSSTNGLLHTWTLTDRIAREAGFPEHRQLKHFVPIHALSGPKMSGAVMIDCTDPDTLARSVSCEIARIMKMESEHVSLEDHDRKIAVKQMQFHLGVWHFVNKTELISWIKLLTLSQRRAVIGEWRVLLRPDISAELLERFGIKNIALPDDQKKHDIGLLESLNSLINNRDPDGLIRNWVRTENVRMDEGEPGGPRSFQEFLRNRN